MEKIEKELLFQKMLSTNENFLKLFEKILGKKIDYIDFIGTELFDTITEYDFSLHKFNVLYDKDKKIEIYLKMIKGGKIKESIFCFWSLLYEEYLKENKDLYENKKVLIKQKKVNECDSNILLTFDQSLDYCAEINLIELKKFALDDKNIERWLDELEVKNEDILFIGRKNA